MNVIEHIRKQANALELFEKTFSLELTSFHFDKPSWESSATFIVMNKSEVANIDNALMVSVIQNFVRFGDYYFNDSPKNDIYNKCVEHLDDHYGNANFDLTEKISLKDCIRRFFSDTQQRIYENYKWEIQVSVELIKNLEWTKQSTYKTYHLKSEWNDEDYIFETKDYFIRFNWGTSA
jgi:hypothetical protein